MKIEGKIIGRIHLGKESGNEYTLVCSEAIALGTEVTVEWKEEPHYCQNLTQAGLRITRWRDWWCVTWKVGEETWRMRAWHCPGCGKELT